ncbi:hypothetical protein EV121DRAFT_298050 [Schizophyllum commune]
MLSDELPDKIVACEKRPGHDHSTPSIHYLRRMYFPMYHDKQLDPETLLITMTDDEGLIMTLLFSTLNGSTLSRRPFS